MRKDNRWLVFDKQWLNTNQTALLELLNSRVCGWLVRTALGIRSAAYIRKITPNSVHFAHSEADLVTAEFYTGWVFSRAIYKAFKYGWLSIHAWDTLVANRLNPALNLGYDSLEKKPDANPETNTVDGFVENTNSSWATCRAASAGTAVNDAIPTFSTGTRLAAGVYTIARSIFLFDTSSLPDQAALISVILSLYGSSKSGTGTVAITTSSPASNTGLVTGDFDQISATECSARMNFTAWSTTGYNDFTLNATGFNNISKTGISKFGARSDRDLDDSAPGSNGDYLVAAYAADQGASQAPKLTITYGASFPAVMMVD